MGEETFSREDVCKIILERAHEVAKEQDEEVGKKRLEDVDISATQLWEHGNIMIRLKCSPKMVLEARQLSSRAVDKYYKLKAGIGTSSVQV